MKDDRMYLEHMLERAERVARYISDGREALIASEQTQDAVIRNLEVIGEAAKHVSKSTRDRIPALDWRRIAGMRDILIHNYMGVDLGEVWNAASRDVPAMAEALRRFLASV